MFEAPDPTGTVEQRSAALVAQRTRLYETIAPVRRMAIRLAPRSRPIAAELARANVVLRGHLTALLAPESAGWSPARCCASSVDGPRIRRQCDSPRSLRGSGRPGDLALVENVGRPRRRSRAQRLRVTAPGDTFRG